MFATDAEQSGAAAPCCYSDETLWGDTDRFDLR